MAVTRSADDLYLAASGLATTVAVSAALSPRHLLRLFGIPAKEVTGAAAFGWRLFAVRTAFIGIAGLRGSTVAQEAILPVQVADQLVFAHAYRTRAIPRRAAVMAMAVSGVLIALTGTARARG